MAEEKLKRAEVTIRKRVECEEKAFHIVNKLVDGCVDGTYLSECGKRISQENYDDIVEERSIIKICGYPLCDQALPNVPKKKYHISTKANKVYDISERKKFCSNQCFKASNIFKEQIPESPVWSRDKDKIKIAISPHKGVPGLVGDEVIGERPKNTLEKEVEVLEELDKRFEKKNKDNEEKSNLKESGSLKEPLVTQVKEKDSTNNSAPSVSNPTEKESSKSTFGLEQCSIVDNIHNDLGKLHLNDSDPRNSRSTESHDNESSGEGKQSHSSSKLEQLQILLNKRKGVLSRMVDFQDTTKCKMSEDDHHIKPSIANKTDKKSHNFSKESENLPKKKAGASPDIAQSPLCLICGVLKKWVSVGTVEYLQFKSTKSDQVDSVSTSLSDLQIQVDCVNLAKNLDIQEKQFDCLLGDGAGTDAPAEDTKRETKSVPDYKALKKEAEEFQLKVTEYITGKRPKQDTKEKKETGEDAVYIPTVDAHDQSQIRAKIVLEKLDKYLPDLLIPMGLAVQDVSTHVRELVYTFRLEKDTISFKPAEWTLVSLVLLKMLSFRVQVIQDAFNNDSTMRHFTVLLKGIKNTVEDLDVFTTDILSDAAVSFRPS